MSGAAALDDLFPRPAAPPNPRRKRGLFDHLDPERPVYAVQAAAIIAGLHDLSKVERALAQVEPRDLKTVTTLTLIGIALRIAKLSSLDERRALLSTLPPDFQLRCEPHVKRFYQVKPWLRIARVASEPLPPPAYGRGLVAVRMAGFHPLMVNVLYANDWAPAKAYQAAAARARERRIEPFSHKWRERAGFPWVVVPPRSYAPGTTDWRVLAGVMSVLHDPEGRALDGAGRPARSFVSLVNELAQVSYVSVKSAVTSIGEMGADSLAYCWSVFTGNRRSQWPDWWSDDLDREHGRRFEEWRRDAERWAARSAA